MQPHRSRQRVIDRSGHVVDLIRHPRAALAGLLPPQGISTRLLILRNMSVINTCAVVNVRGPGLTLPAVQTLLGLFSMASLFRSVRCVLRSA